MKKLWRWIKWLFNEEPDTYVPPIVPELSAEDEPNRVYHNLLNTYSLSADGSGFYKQGYAILDSDEATAFLDSQIIPVFGIVQLEFEQKARGLKDSQDRGLATVDVEISRIAGLLDENDTEGYLHKVNEQIAHFQRAEKDIENTIFPEKEFQRIIKTTSDEYNKTMTNSGKTGRVIEQTLQDAIAQKEILSSAHRMVTFFKNSHGRLSSVRHSLLYPPKIQYIVAFYLVCLFLLIAELGFTMTVFFKLMKTPFPNADPMFTVFYAVGIALSFAILFKILIDMLLHRGREGRLIFGAVLLLVFIVLMELFSYNIRAGGEVSGVKLLPTYKGLILGFFSVSFSLANAFLLREALYLHHLRFRLKGSLSIPRLKKERQQYIDQWYRRLNSLKSLKARLENGQVLYSDTAITERAGLISNLRKLSINSFNRGHSQRIQDMILRHEDLALLLYQKNKPPKPDQPNP